MAAPRRMLERRRDLDYVSLHGLSALTGCDPERLDEIVVKELVDNALDACGEDPKVEVSFEEAGDLVGISVWGNGRELTKQDVTKITDFDRAYSTTFHYRFPTRGRLGNAFKCVMAAPYALSKRIKNPLTIISGGREYVVGLEINELGQRVRSRVSQVQRTPPTVRGTRVSVVLPKYASSWGRKYQYGKMMMAYAIFNPEASFRVVYVRDPKPIVCEWPAIGRRQKRFLGGSSIHWYTYDGFHQLVLAYIRDLQRSRERETVRHWIRQFRGLSSDEKASEIAGEVEAQHLSELRPADIKRLYESMRRHSGCPEASVLGRVGKQRIRERLTQLFGEPTHFRYKRVEEVYQGKEFVVPYVLEVAMAVYKRGEIDRQIFAGINHSPCMANPFAGWVLSRYDKERGKREEFEIGEVMAKHGVDFHEPVVLVIHLICPNIEYQSYGKTRIDITPFQSEFTKVFTKMCRSYRRLRQSNRFRASRSKRLLEYEILRRVEMKNFSGGVIPPNEWTTQNGIYYKIRNLMGGDIGMKRRSFIAGIRRVCSDLGVTREEVGIYASVRAELYFKGSTYPVSVENIEKLAEKGCDVILVEKEGITRVLAPLADEKGVALVNSRGFVVEYAQELLELSKRRGGNLFLLTDYDASGLLMEQKLLMEIPRLGVTPEMLSELGLDRRDLEEKYDTKDGRAPKNHLKALPPELQREVAETRVEIDAVLNAAGQDRFWEYLERVMVKLAPKRDLTRSIDLSIKLPEQVERPLGAIRRFIEEVGKPKQKEIALELRDWRGGLVKIREVEQAIQREIQGETLREEAVLKLIRKLNDLANALPKKPQNPHSQPWLGTAKNRKFWERCMQTGKWREPSDHFDQEGGEVEL